MHVLQAAVAANPWPLRRERAAELAERHPHAAEMLRLYQALTVVQEAAAYRLPSPQDIASFAVGHVIPGVIDVTVELGPRALRDGVVEVYASANLEELIQRWLVAEPLNPFETYLARASASPLLEALSPHPDPPPQGGREFEIEVSRTHCPNCGGLPQLSYFAVSGEALVSGPRYLVCSRCATNWIFPRMTCAACGEAAGTKLPIFQEQERFPHARVDGCQTCQKYLLTFDLRRDTRAVPVVDEIAALPLDLYAKDQGLTKIAPNLMGN
ncbi:MAG TPA: formate dehydrogenase accessory protein FdhE [Candidatus Dormibacteraeota bacterium]|nr:formate dehydrogenase accessory protein FdhE [Candidatus Dormibacteraeota bacterium]